MIETKKIVQWPDPVLSTKLTQVGEVTEEIKKIANELTKTMLVNGGLGLTANQIGYTQCMFCMLKDDGVMVVIDPQIIAKRGEIEFKKEGCLSLASISARIGRQTDIDVVYTDLEGLIQTKTLTEIEARVFQHEYDHTKGIMIFDHMPKIMRKFTLDKYYKKR